MAQFIIFLCAFVACSLATLTDPFPANEVVSPAYVDVGITGQRFGIDVWLPQSTPNGRQLVGGPMFVGNTTTALNWTLHSPNITQEWQFRLDMEFDQFVAEVQPPSVVTVDWVTMWFFVQIKWNETAQMELPETRLKYALKTNTVIRTVIQTLVGLLTLPRDNNSTGETELTTSGVIDTESMLYIPAASSSLSAVVNVTLHQNLTCVVSCGCQVVFSVLNHTAGITNVTIVQGFGVITDCLYVIPALGCGGCFRVIASLTPARCTSPTALPVSITILGTITSYYGPDVLITLAIPIDVKTLEGAVLCNTNMTRVYHERIHYTYVDVEWLVCLESYAMTLITTAFIGIAFALIDKFMQFLALQR